MSLNSSGIYRFYADPEVAVKASSGVVRQQFARQFARPVRMAPAPWQQESVITGTPGLRWDRFDVVSRVQNPLSRPLDVILASLMIVGFLPLFLLVMIAIWLDDPGPAVFSHRRVGYKGRMFPCYKFRSMYVGAERRLERMLREDPDLRRSWERDHKLHADPRVTRIGRILRVSSLDELPQLFNVLRGEMSLVGPRPIVRAEIARYGHYINHYYAVRPGLTGLWQVAGRSSVSYRRRVAADVKYARVHSLAMDLRILVATIPCVSTGRGSC